MGVKVCRDVGDAEFPPGQASKTTSSVPSQGMIVAFLTFEALKEALGAGEHKRLALQQQQQLQRTSQQQQQQQQLQRTSQQQQQQQQQQGGSRHHLSSGRGDAAGWIGSGEGEGEEERRRRRGEELAAGDEREQLERMRLAENAEEV